MVRAASVAVMQLKVDLQDVQPPVWRRLLVPGSSTLASLHAVIQIAFGWEDSHLHVFRIHGREYGPEDVEDGGEIRSEGIALAKLDLKARMSFIYEYDLGDSWVHEVRVEKVLVPQEPVALPVCLEGQRAGPPEDCGGPWGYQDMLDILADPGHPDHGETKDWLGGAWDPEAFRLEEVNAALGRAFAAKPGRTGRPPRN